MSKTDTYFKRYKKLYNFLTTYIKWSDILFRMLKFIKLQVGGVIC